MLSYWYVFCFNVQILKKINFIAVLQLFCTLNVCDNFTPLLSVCFGYWRIQIIIILFSLSLGDWRERIADIHMHIKCIEMCVMHLFGPRQMYLYFHCYFRGLYWKNVISLSYLLCACFIIFCYLCSRVAI